MEAYIKAISYYLPEGVLTNEEFVKEFPEWTTEKIEKKLGIKVRHITAKDETAADLAVCAANRLFEESNIDRSEIDYLLFCTESFDYILPTTACVIQDRLDLPNSIGVLDIGLGCSGWVAGLATAKGLVVSGVAKNVLLLTAETYSKYLHPKDKSNRTIFGDGAAATLISDSGLGRIGGFSFGTDGKGAENLIVKSGASRHRQLYNDLTFDDYGNPKSSDFIYMDGPAILNYTLDRIPGLVGDVLSKNGLQLDDVNLHVYHQANKYIADLQRRKMRIVPEKYYHCYENSGNTVSSTIPIALYEAIKDGSIVNGSTVLSVAQGLGYTWGGVALFF